MTKLKNKFLTILFLIFSVLCCCFAFGLMGCTLNCEGNKSANTEQTGSDGGTISGGDENCEHKWSSWTIVSSATCTEKGKQERSCSVCGGKETKEIPALGHSFNTSNICTKCGFELTPTVGLEYELIEEKSDSYYAVIGMGNADAKEIVIPAYHAGKSVSKIADNAFYGIDFITNVYLTGNIKEIGKEAFYWCENLSELTISIPTNSLIINEKAFYGCTKLKNISLPDKISEIYSDSFANTGYYNDKSNWHNGVLILSGWVLATDSTTPAEVTLGSSSKGIANNALSNSNITKIIIEASIKCTEKSFTNSKITSATIPAGIENYLPKTKISELNITSGRLWAKSLSGFGHLQKLTIPTLQFSANSACEQFHYLFGTTQYDGAIGVKRGYRNSSDRYETATTLYYLPANLQELTVLSDFIPNYAFSEIKSITKINIGSKVSGLGKYICFNGNEQAVINFAGETEFLSVTKKALSYIISDDWLDYKYAKLKIDNKEIIDFKIPDGTTNIKECTFINCAELKSITIPSSVSSIGKYAFDGCESLTGAYITDIAAWCNISFENSRANPLYFAQNLYLNNILVTNLNILDGVKKINDYAFCYCSSLDDNISIPSSVTSVGEGAFMGTSYYKNPSNWHDEVLYIGNYLIKAKSSLSGTYEIDDKTKVIAGGAFTDCADIAKIVIPNSVVVIGENAFNGCDGLIGVYISDIDSWCNIEFENSYSNPVCLAHTLYVNNDPVTKIDISSGITQIKNYAFAYCTNLESITIPDSVTSIGDYAFEYCTSLEGVYINDIVAWCNIEFETSYSNPLYYAGNLYINDELVTSLNIPGNISEIKKYAFEGCESISSVIIDNGVTSIGSSAFYYCNMKSITIPDSVTSIGVGAFNCSNLEKLSMGTGITTIGEEAFSCDNLKGVYIKDIGAWCNIKFSDSGHNTVNNYSQNPLYYAKNLYLNDELVEELIIPQSVSQIYDMAFLNCRSLVSIIIPNSITSIGSKAFEGCYKLVEVINLSSLPIQKGGSGYGGVAYFAQNVSNSSNENNIAQSNDYIFYENGETVYLLGYNGSDSELQLPNKYNGKNYEIYKYAFYNNNDITKVTIPASVTSIGQYAFAGCKRLSSIIIGDNVTTIGEYAFYYCANLISVTIGHNVNAINKSAFSGCGKLLEVINLSEISISKKSSSNGYVAYYAKNVVNSADGTKIIESETNYIFYEDAETAYLLGYNGSDTELQLPNKYNDESYEIYVYAFYNNDITKVTIPDGVTSIGSYAFEYCTSLTEITIDNSVTSIGSYAFEYCTSLTSITIPDSVTSIGIDAFYKCTSITEITIPDNVTSIGKDAFYGCGNIKTATMPTLAIKYIPKGNLQTVILTSGDSIGYEAFSGCKSLKEITIPDGVTSIGSGAFYDTAYYNDEANWKNDVLYIGNYLIEAKDTLSGIYQIALGTKLIADVAFEDCTSLTEINIPDSVTSIGEHAFSGCTSLTEITIPDSVTSIGIDAFYKCTSITEITIPDSVTSIGHYAFYGCTSLEIVIFENTTGWKVSYYSDMSNSKEINVENPEQNAENLKGKYCDYYWERI